MQRTTDQIPGTPYTIYQSPSNFRYGIDAILLSWFAKAHAEAQAIDLCSGTGIVALRHHHLYKTKQTYAVEIQDDLAELATQSVETNALEETIRILHGDFTRMEDCFRPDSIDVITANPPYIKAGEGEISHDLGRAQARHEITMKLHDIFSFSGRVLRTGGMLYLIHRPQRLTEILLAGMECALPVKTLLPVASQPGEDPQLLLVACKKGAKPDLQLKAPLIIYNGEEYTETVLSIYEGAVR